MYIYSPQNTASLPLSRMASCAHVAASQLPAFLLRFGQLLVVFEDKDLVVHRELGKGRVQLPDGDEMPDQRGQIRLAGQPGRSLGGGAAEGPLLPAVLAHWLPARDHDPMVAGSHRHR